MTTHKEIREYAEQDCAFNKYDDFYIICCDNCKNKGAATESFIDSKRLVSCDNCERTGSYTIIEEPIRDNMPYFKEDCRLSNDVNHIITQRLLNLFNIATGLSVETKKDFKLKFKKIEVELRWSEFDNILLTYDNGKVSWDAVPEIPSDMVYEIRKLFK